MIENIQEVSLDDFNAEEEGSGYWSYDESCDFCGKQICCSGLFAQNMKPNEDRLSRCLECYYEQPSEG